MKILKFIVIVLFLLVIEQIASAQYYLKVKSDSLSLETDSIRLFIDEYRGEITWQASLDMKNWVSLIGTNDTLVVSIDSTAYYRATLVDGSCNPVFSDTVFLLEKITITNSNELTVDSHGGVFLLPNGVKVKIPKGAVIEPKTVRLELLGYDEANALDSIQIDENTLFLSGFSIATDLFNFKKPIKIKIPFKDMDKTSIPILYMLNNESKGWVHSEKSMIVNIRDHFVEIILTGSDTKKSSQQTNATSSFDDINNFFLKLYGDFFWSDDPCKNDYKVETKDFDYDNSGGCIVLNAEQELVFASCVPPLVEPYSATEISPVCKPQLEIIPGGELKLEKNKSLIISLKASIGELPLAEQEIKLNTSGNLSITTPLIFTGTNGSTSFSVTGIDVGEGVISISVSYEYYLTTIFAEANGQSEKGVSDLVKIKQDYTINVTVYDIPEVATGTTSDIKCTSATVSGTVINDNYDPVTESGVEVNGTKYPAGNGSGIFSAFLSGLECDKTYYAKAYATNPAGTGYGSTVSFTTKKLNECVTVSSKVWYRMDCLYLVLTSISANENVQITEKGFYYGFEPNPELTGIMVSQGEGTNAFYSLFGKKSGKTYYVKGYASNKCGTVYGNELILLPLTDSVTDIDGNVYKTTKIGNQIWMAENLRTTHYNDGSNIPYLENIYNSSGMFDGYYGWYNDNPDFKNPYGALYGWNTISSGKLCPAGWHVSTDDEWVKLVFYVDSGAVNDPSPWVGSPWKASTIAGGILKATGTIEGGDGLWESPNTGATNEYCFSALPTGLFVYYQGEYDFYGWIAMGRFVYYWSIRTEFFPDLIPCFWVFSTTGREIYKEYPTYETSLGGYPVRCVKDSFGTNSQKKDTSYPIQTDSINFIPTNGGSGKNVLYLFLVLFQLITKSCYMMIRNWS